MNIRDRIIEFRRVPAKELQPNPRNWRTHPKAQQDAMRGILAEIGYAGANLAYRPSDGGLRLIDGHMRTEIYPDGLIPTLITDLTEEEAALLLASFDPIGAMAGSDKAKVEALLGSVKTENQGLKEMFADMATQAGILMGEVTQDEVPEPPDDPVTQPGDLWVLGNHRLLCGDSSKVEDVDRLLGGAVIHLVDIDPPYNVNVEPRSNNAISSGIGGMPSPYQNRQLLHHQSLDLARYPGKSKCTTTKMRAKDRKLINDFISDEQFDALLDAWFGNASRVLQPGRAFYVWGGYANCANYPPFLKKHGLYFSQAIIWDKQHPVLTRKDFMGAHEWCFYGWKEGAGHKFFGPNNAQDIWHVKKIPPQRMEHLTAKPAELAVRALQYSTVAGEHVLDLFGGSGSTLIAAEQTSRRAFLMELDQAYCDVIILRWEKLTGRKAMLAEGEGTKAHKENGKEVSATQVHA